MMMALIHDSRTLIKPTQSSEFKICNPFETDLRNINLTFNVFPMFWNIMVSQFDINCEKVLKPENKFEGASYAESFDKLL